MILSPGFMAVCSVCGARATVHGAYHPSTSRKKQEEAVRVQLRRRGWHCETETICDVCPSCVADEKYPDAPPAPHLKEGG